MITVFAKKLLSRLLFLGTLMLIVLLGLGVGNTLPASAALRQLEEAPGQQVYQSRQTLKDQTGNTWQAITFKRIRPNHQTSFALRLVGFPGVVEIDHTRPLLLTNSLGKTLSALDISSQIFEKSAVTAPNVAQYDLQPLLPQLQAEIPLQLTLPTVGASAITLTVPPTLIQEWQTVANFEAPDL